MGSHAPEERSWHALTTEVDLSIMQHDHLKGVLLMTSTYHLYMNGSKRHGFGQDGICIFHSSSP